jgi:hypothetical protein
MVRNMIQKALPLIALMFVVVTARYAIAKVKVPACYAKCKGKVGSFCSNCCLQSCDTRDQLNCQDACPLAFDSPDTVWSDVNTSDQLSNGTTSSSGQQPVLQRGLERLKSP